MKQICPACGCETDSREEKCPRCGAPLSPAAGSGAPVPPEVPAEEEGARTAAPEPPAVPPEVPAAPEEAPEETDAAGSAAPEPPAVPPPFGGGKRTDTPEAPRKKSHVWIYITIAALCVAVAAIVVAYVLGARHTTRSYDYSSLDSLPAPVETVADEPYAPYEAEDFATDTLATDTLATDSVAAAETTANLILTGTLVLLSDESTTCDVMIHATVDADGQVTGTASWNGGESDITGRYDHAEERLTLRESDGSCYDGHIRSGYSYNGTYEDRNGTWRFTMNIN